MAINALQSVSSPHRFLGINQQGGVSIVTTKGNPATGHVVLRGGSATRRTTIRSASRSASRT
ncbi:hypothetical protein P4132_31250 [Pseudomonas aeruginosa]|nr:hypothetical protein [Pseudomonas aeruginosa]